MSKKRTKVFLELLEEELSESSFRSFNLNDYGIEMIYNIVKANNRGIYIDPIKITASSGAVLVLIYPNFVIKIFDDGDVLKKVLKIVKSSGESDFIVRIYGSILIDCKNLKEGNLEIIDIPNQNKFYALVTEKLDPLIGYISYKSTLKYNVFENLKTTMKLVLQVGDALSFIHDGKDELPYTHGDCTIDNIGYQDNSFVLFDFNSGSLTKKNTSNDIHTFIRSIKFHLKTNMIKDKSIDGFINYISASKLKDGYQLVLSVFSYYREFIEDELTDEQIFSELSNVTILKIIV